MIVIADNLVVEAGILNRKLRAATTDLQDLLTQAPPLPSPHSRETLAKGLHDGGGESFAGGFALTELPHTDDIKPGGVQHRVAFILLRSGADVVLER
jgi:hypothetical protein